MASSSDILALDPNASVVVLGDLNDFEFAAPLNILKDAGLTALIETLPASERYTLRVRRQLPRRSTTSWSAGSCSTTRGRYGIRRRPRQRGVPRPGVGPRPADRAADDAGADDLGVRARRPRTPAGWNNTAVTVSFTC